MTPEPRNDSGNLASDDPQSALPPFQRVLSRAKTLRDEIRVKLHLGNMDMKDRFAELHARVEEAERHAESATHDAVQALEETATRLEKLAAQLQLHLDAP